MNFDGAWNPTIVRGAGIGFIIRDYNGFALVAGAGGGPHILSALLAELYAALWALESLEPLTIPSDIILEGDSATAMEWLNGTPGSLHPALRAAKVLMGRLRKVDISLIPRSLNTTADNLARHGKTIHSKVLWSRLPPLDLINRLDLPAFVAPAGTPSVVVDVT